MRLLVGVICVTLLFQTLVTSETIDDWPLTSSNSDITDIPTIQDFVPLGVEFVKTSSNELKWNGLKWRLSCFIMVGIAKTSRGKPFLFQLRIPHPVHGGHDSNTDLFYLNGRWHAFYTLYSPTYFDEGELFGYPTVYTYGRYVDGGECIGSISYNVDEREWIYRVTPLSEGGVELEIKVHPRGVPYWMGKPEGPYIIHGAIFNREDIDIWGGFWEVGPCEGMIEKPGVGRVEFTGCTIWDRAYHRVYYSDTAIGAAGAPLSFTCGYIYDDDLQLCIGYAENPSPIVPPVPFQHQGRLSFPSRDLSFRFDGYELRDNGGLQPSVFYIDGTYDGGEVHLRGEVSLFYPYKWKVGKGTWWDYNASRTWGRAFIRWNGTITLYGETITVRDAVGVFECTRYQGSGLSVRIVKPKENHLYLFDREVSIFPFTLVVGGLTIEAAGSGVSRIEFYIDDVLKSIDDEAPYSWLWDEFAIGIHEIKVIAYDKEGNEARDELDVIIFNFWRRVR